MRQRGDRPHLLSETQERDALAQARRDRRQGGDVDAVTRRLGDKARRLGALAQADQRP